VNRSKVWTALVALAGIGAAPGPARAADKTAVLDAPAPPTLPALAHPLLTYTFEFTAASIKPTGAPEGVHAYAWFAHNELELPLQSRQWYLGAAHDIAAGAVPGVGHDFFFGNPEIWGRGLWSSVRGLSSGGGLGLVLPLPRDLSEQALSVLGTVRVVRPWDAAYFNDRILTLRPWFDIRHVTGPLIVQLRQGLDVAFTLRELKPTERRIDLTARATLYIGYRATEAIGFGLEVWEVYPLTATIPDDKRASVAISPSIRFLLGRVAPALSVLLPITTPLRGEAASYYAARLNVGFDLAAGKSSPGQAPPRTPGAGP
jgi:hypothetical protein